MRKVVLDQACAMPPGSFPPRIRGNLLRPMSTASTKNPKAKKTNGPCTAAASPNRYASKSALLNAACSSAVRI